MITPQQARAELARREIARRKASSSQVNPPTFTNGVQAAFGNKEAMASQLGITPEQLESQVQENRAGLLPLIGQAVGSPFGGIGATGGAMVGQAANQAIRAIPGQKFIPEGKPSLGTVGKEGLITGLIETLTRGAGKLIFRRQFAKEKLGELGKKLGGMKKSMSADESLGIPSEDIYMPLKQQLEEVAVPHGPQATLINKWLRFMEKNPRLSAKNLIEMEKDLGEVARYGEFSKGAIIMPSIKKPALNEMAKSSRKQVSNVVDDIAEQSGNKGFKDISSKIAKLLKDPDTTDVTKSSGNVLSRVLAGTAAGGMTMNPAVGLATYYGLQGLQSPKLRNMAFRAGRSTAGKLVTKGSKLALSDMARRISNQ